MKKWRLWIGLLVSVLCLHLAVRDIDVRSLLEALRQVQLVWLLLALGLLFVVALSRAYRWRLLFYPLQGLRIRRLFHLLNIGYLVSSVTPLRLGDVLKAYLFAELEGFSAVRALSTVVVERIADTLAIVVLLLVLLPQVSLPAHLIRPALAVGLAAAGAVAVMAGVALRRQTSLALLNRVSARVAILKREPIRRSVLSAVDGLAALGSWAQVWRVGAWSLLIWLCAAVQYYLVMPAMGLALPFTAALLVLCLTSLGMVIPSSPGYVGVLEYLTVLSLSLFGVTKEAALGYALVLHALLYLSSSILGAVGLWAEGYSYVRLRQVLSEAEPTVLPT
jgi:uncharacterized protein (TIRG00374 family)